MNVARLVWCGGGGGGGVEGFRLLALFLLIILHELDSFHQKVTSAVDENSNEHEYANVKMRKFLPIYEY